MRGFAFCPFILAVVLLLPVQAAALEPREIALSGGISLLVPPEYSIETERGPDFLVRYVLNEARVVLGVYSGNAAANEADFRDRAVVGGCSAFSRLIDDNGTRGRDVFVPLNNRFPSQIHMFYRSLSLEQAELSDKIINSFHLHDAAMCAAD